MCKSNYSRNRNILILILCILCLGVAWVYFLKCAHWSFPLKKCIRSGCHMTFKWDIESHFRWKRYCSPNGNFFIFYFFSNMTLNTSHLNVTWHPYEKQSCFIRHWTYLQKNKGTYSAFFKNKKTSMRLLKTKGYGLLFSRINIDIGLMNKIMLFTINSHHRGWVYTT